MRYLVHVPLRVVVFLCLYFSGGISLFAATTVVDQTDWSGGPGATTRNHYSSAVNIDVSGGQIRLADTADWFDSAWIYRRRISFDNSSQTEGLTQFAALIRLTSRNFDFTKIRSGCQDLRFAQSDGRTLLSYEIEKCDLTPTSGLVLVWVKVPEIAAGSRTDFIFMYYGNPGAPDAQDKINVWDSNYTRVWHFNLLPLVDSTSHLQTALPNETTTRTSPRTATPTTAAMGNGFRFDGLVDFFMAPDTLPDTSLKFNGGQLTINAMVKIGSTETTGGDIVSKPWNGAGSYNYRLIIRSWGAVGFWVEGGAREFSYLVTNQAMTRDVEHMVTATIDGSGIMHIYVDGDEWASQAHGITRWPPADSPINGGDRNVALCMGSVYPFGPSWPGHNEYSFDGVIDDVTLSHIARSPSWIRANYQQLMDTFSRVGPEENSFALNGSLISNAFCTGSEGTKWLMTNYHSNDQGTITVKVRTANDSTMAGAVDFSECHSVTSGGALAGNDCVQEGHRCLQYAIAMEGRTQNPSISRFSITYEIPPPPVTPVQPAPPSSVTLVVPPDAITVDLPALPSPAPSPVVTPSPPPPAVVPPTPTTEEERNISTLGEAMISETEGKTEVTQDESSTDTYSVALTREPSAEVMVQIVADSSLVVNPSLLTFTPTNWNTPQTITIESAGQSSMVLQENVTAMIHHNMRSTDAQYDHVFAADVPVRIIASPSQNSNQVVSPVVSAGCSLMLSSHK